MENTTQPEAEAVAALKANCITLHGKPPNRHQTTMATSHLEASIVLDRAHTSAKMRLAQQANAHMRLQAPLESEQLAPTSQSPASVRSQIRTRISTTACLRIRATLCTHTQSNTNSPDHHHKQAGPAAGLRYASDCASIRPAECLASLCLSCTCGSVAAELTSYASPRHTRSKHPILSKLHPKARNELGRNEPTQFSNARPKDTSTIAALTRNLENDTGSRPPLQSLLQARKHLTWSARSLRYVRAA